MNYLGYDIYINLEYQLFNKDSILRFSLLSPSGNSFFEVFPEYDFFEYNDAKYFKFLIKSDLINEFGDYIFIVEDQNGNKVKQKFSVSIPPTSYRSNLETTILYGYINSISGKPSSPNKHYLVSVRPVDLPLQLQSNFITGENIQTYSNSNGYFELVIAKGANVVIEIPEIPIRFQYYIPHDSRNSIDVGELWKNIILGRDKKNKSI